MWKRLIPNYLWIIFRKYYILYTHRIVGKICNHLIDDYYAGKIIPYPIRPKKKFANEFVIWQYWGQGFENVPEIVRICLDSVERYKGIYKLIRLNDGNLSEYIDFPEEIIRKRDRFQRTAFSDLLRLVLLATYGGVWLDATVLLTGELPNDYSAYDLFLYQRDNNEKNKKYWENSFAYYWGWYRGFKVHALNSIIFAKKNNKTIVDLCNIMFSYWMNNQKYPHYFFFQILYNELIMNKPEMNCPIVSDCVPHFLMQAVTDDSFYMSFKDAIKLTTIHKMTFKMSDACVEKFKALYNSL